MVILEDCAKLIEFCSTTTYRIIAIYCRMEHHRGAPYGETYRVGGVRRSAYDPNRRGPLFVRRVRQAFLARGMSCPIAGFSALSGCTSILFLAVPGRSACPLFLDRPAFRHACGAANLRRHDARIHCPEHWRLASTGIGPRGAFSWKRPRFPKFLMPGGRLKSSRLRHSDPRWSYCVCAFAQQSKSKAPDCPEHWVFVAATLRKEKPAI
jgi:hypothetical protein